MDFGHRPKPFKLRKAEPSITVYFTRDDTEEMYEVSCMFCKRTVIDFKGKIIKLINAPMPNKQHSVVFTARCKQCKQDWRFMLVSTEATV